MSRRFHATFGGLPPAFWTLWTGTLINRLGSFVVPFLSIYLTGARKIPVDVTGLIVSLYGLGTIVAGLVGGILSDRLGRRTTLLLSLVGGASAMLGLGFARSVAAIAPLVFLVAMLSDMARPAAAAMISDVVPPADRLRAYGLQYWAVNLGFSVAPVVAGLMAGWSFLALFVGDAATTLLYAVVVYLRLPESHAAATVPRDSSWHGMGVVLEDRPYLVFAVVGILVGLVYRQAEITMAVDMLAHGIPPRTYGLVIALNGVLIVLLSPTMSRALSSRPRLPTLAVAATLTGLGFGINALAGPTFVYAAGVLVWTLGEIASSGATSAFIAERAPAHARGRYQGFFAMTWGLAAFAAPTLGGIVYRRLGPTALWTGCLALGLLATVGFIALDAALRRRPRA